jgi:hypothetical protein
MDNYRVTSWQRFRIFKSSKQDFSKFCYSLGVSVGLQDGGPDDYFSPSSLIKFVMELNSGFDLNKKHSSRPLMLNLTSPILTSMWAFAVLRKGLPRMSDTFESGCMSNTTKSLVWRILWFWLEYPQQFLQGSELTSLLVVGTLMLGWVLNDEVCQRLSWVSHWHLLQGHTTHC